VRVIDHHRYINEEFDLIIKNYGEAEPEKHEGCLDKVTMKVAHVSTYFSSRGEDGEGGQEDGQGWFVKINKSLPKQFQMKNLGRNQGE